MNFCTYFDSYYMVKGLALYKSIERVSDNFHLYVMAFDKECYDKLKALDLNHMTVEFISEIENPELLAVKSTRSRGEYCWTCGPAVIQYFLNKHNLENITYLDSDLMFLSNPKIIANEVGDASIAITEQGIGKKEEKLYGKYCVQYLTFRNDKNGSEALEWWKNACIDWCFQRLESNRFGDQKYLDEFPKRWNNVYVIKNLGVGIAPWNMHRYEYKDNSFTYNGQDYPFVFFHMHGVKVDYIDNNLHISSTHQALSKATIEKFYQPYANLLKDVLINYYGFSVTQIFIHDMTPLKKLEYRIRGVVRNNALVRWLWFSLLRKKYLGHGTKL